MTSASPGQPSCFLPYPIACCWGPAEEIQSLRQRLEKVSSGIRRIDEMRNTEELTNKELFEREYLGRVEGAEEVRRNIRGLERLKTA